MAILQSMNVDLLLYSVLDSLECLSYSGKLLEESALRNAVQKGLASPDYRHICTSLCEELKALNQMQECISKVSGPEDFESFQLEFRGFLQELKCPHSSLADSLDLFDSRLLLLDFLLSELIAARLIASRKSASEEALESHTVSGDLSRILKALGMSKPPSHVKAEQMFSRIIEKTKSVVQTASSGHLGPGLVTKSIPKDQWALVERMNDALTKEYSVRREVLLTRCDVTIQSFKWSDKAKQKTADQFTKLCQVERDRLQRVAMVTIPQMLAAKEDLLQVRRTGDKDAITSNIKKVVIGKVPDRGGRPSETRPPPEMPTFRQRTEGPPMGKREGAGGGGGRGHGGKRVQGGWSGKRAQSDDRGGSWHKGASYERQLSQGTEKTYYS